MKIASTIIITISLSSTDLFGCATADLIANFAPPADGGIILTRPTNQHEWLTPDGEFKIHYDTEGPYAVYRPEEDVNPPDGIPDYVNRCADFLIESRRVIVDVLEFDPPPSDGEQGGDSRYDIYISNVPALTTPESPSDEYPGRPAYTSYIQLGHDMRTPRYPDDPLPYLKISAAHEYFHAVQFAYRAYSSDITPWWFESSAVWMEEVVFDDVNDVYYQVPDYLPHLHKSLYQTSGFFIYGAWLYPDFLSESIGPWIIKRTWEKFASFDRALQALKLSFDEFGLDFNTEYCRHTVWDFFTGENYRPGFYEEGSVFNASVTVAATHTEYPVPWSEQPLSQQNVSAVYIQFIKPAISQGSLVLEYENPTDNLQYISIVALRLSGEIEYSIHRIVNHIVPMFVVRDFQTCEKVVAIPVWGYEGDDIEGTTVYNYRAYIDSTTTAISDAEETPRQFSLQGVYPNPFNGSVSIAFSSPGDYDYSIELYDFIGRLVLAGNGIGVRGLNRVNLDMPESLAGGIYLFSITLDHQVLNGKMIYLK